MGIVLVLAALVAATLWACLKASSDADEAATRVERRDRSEV